jgi:hypothetical protein
LHGALSSEFDVSNRLLKLVGTWTENYFFPHDVETRGWGLRHGGKQRTASDIPGGRCSEIPSDFEEFSA